jgi:hypothetical protein
VHVDGRLPQARRRELEQVEPELLDIPLPFDVIREQVAVDPECLALRSP